MSTIRVVIVEEDGRITALQASTFPGAPSGSPAGLLAEVAKVLKAYENGEAEILYSERDGINLIDRR